MLTIKQINGKRFKPLLISDNGVWRISNKFPVPMDRVTRTAADVLRERWHDARIWAENENRQQILL